MNILEFSEVEILYNAIVKADAITPVNSPLQELTLGIADFYNELLINSTDKKRTGPTANEELMYIKLIALKTYIFSISNPKDCGPDFFLISALFTHISNTIVAVLKLVDDGLDYQAFTLLRNLTEIYMTLLTVVESPQKRLEYKHASDAKTAREVWHKFFNKKHFVQMLETYYSRNAEAKEACKNWIDDIYSELSSFAHNDYLNIICYKFSIGENESNPINLWGEYVSRQKVIYERLIKVIAPFELLLNEMLRDDKIDIDFKDFFEDSKKEEVLAMMNLQITISNVSKIILMDYIRNYVKQK